MALHIYGNQSVIPISCLIAQLIKL